MTFITDRYANFGWEIISGIIFLLMTPAQRAHEATQVGGARLYLSQTIAVARNRILLRGPFPSISSHNFFLSP